VKKHGGSRIRAFRLHLIAEELFTVDITAARGAMRRTADFWRELCEKCRVPSRRRKPCANAPLENKGTPTGMPRLTAD